MIILHVVQKLLNTSGLKPVLYVSEPSEGQQLHSWYAKLVPTGFAGKLMVMYVHEPSLLAVLTQGKSIKTTLPRFYERLPLLLQRWGFNPDFIAREMKLVQEGFVVSKTDSRSMLGVMNEMTLHVELRGLKYSSFGLIDLDREEDILMEWLSFDKALGRFRFTNEYWKAKGVLL
ncbi:hypothetical protein FW778_09005 [Ginsengibacter hankyongi]|uniref:DUF6933 domain-containing protein n=1 Tax=Ginsengibacter hankyongi TaxID=2607284 RepID=A0A5J5IQ37_9BACT|nr:hypothetical protein [Ginsengibacter hankyongi]KAA9042137.1 hypothetical protein FW778_09005 [Ginsengibacter hankyongi]